MSAEAPSASTGGASTGRRVKKSAIALLQSRITECFEAKNYYEAEQLYDTLASRIVTSKALQNGDHVAVFSEGVAKFLSLGQVPHAAKVSLLVVQVFEEFQIAETHAHVESILEVVSKFSSDNEEELKGKVELLQAGIRWSSKYGPNAFGAATFHRELARCFWAKQDFSSANSHFLKGDSAIEHAQMLVEWSNNGYRSEVDLFVSRTVLQYLCMENIKNASELYHSFMESFETLNTPLTNFCKLREIIPLICNLDAKF
jgi:hypothetical protein